MAAARLPFWSDDFDMDLLAVLPETPQILGSVADRTLYTVGSLTHGRLNHPALWNSNLGMVAFFGTHPEIQAFLPPGYSTGVNKLAVECTVLEALRDIWIHQCAVVMRGRVVTDSQPLRDPFFQLMYHRRGYRLLSEHDVQAATDALTDWVVEAGGRFSAVLAESV
jgi:hypothetical protein